MTSVLSFSLLFVHRAQPPTYSLLCFIGRSWVLTLHQYPQKLLFKVNRYRRVLNVLAIYSSQCFKKTRSDRMCSTKTMEILIKLIFRTLKTINWRTRQENIILEENFTPRSDQQRYKQLVSIRAFIIHKFRKWSLCSVCDQFASKSSLNFSCVLYLYIRTSFRQTTGAHFQVG